MSDVPRRLVLSGFSYLIAILVLVISEAPLGSSLFFACVLIAVIAYLVALSAGARPERVSPRVLLVAVLFAVAFRIPPAVAPVGADSDMIRYLWDGRIQELGYNPYRTIPADPALASAHTDDTRRMPSLRAATPYPPGAQLFFRLIVTIRESPRTMKVALVICDLLTIFVLWRWMLVIGQSPWPVLVYAWNPLVVLEIAHSGHIDALGALWICTSAYFLSKRKTTLASVTLVLAIATKLLPIVLLPLYWRRIRWRDGLVAGLLLAILYAPFAEGLSLPLGAVPNVVAHIRFNGPIFRGLAGLFSPHVAAAVAVMVGLVVAAWARTRLGRSDPSAWAWPMAASLVCAPVIYPWYLLYFTPFLWSRATAPLAAWTISTLPVYLVWERARHGARWIVPGYVEVFEFAAVLLSLASVVVLSRSLGTHRVTTTDELA